MRILLDTHALLWWFWDERRLSARARDQIADPDNQVLFSSVSAFEIATKHRLGKLGGVPFDPARFGADLTGDRIEVLSVTLEHALAAGALPGPHRDPFDRLLIAQSRLEGLPVVSRDPVFATYAVQLIW